MSASEASAPAEEKFEGGDGPILAAIDGIVDAVDQNVRDERILLQRLHRIRHARASGMSWHEVLQTDEHPETMQLISVLLSRLSMASGSLRRVLALALRQEGVSTLTIARLFGVTHQRVSNLLRRRVP